MIGFALLGLLGVALIVNLVDDDDDATASNAGDDVVTGSADTDIIDAGAGDDTVFAEAGDDLVLAGDGDDDVFGNAGDDLIIGGAGDDLLRGGSEDDLLTADAGNDTLFGDSGDDVLDGTDFADNEGIVQATIAKGAELTNAELAAFIDLTNETGEADTLQGGSGNDDIIAGSNDVVETGVGQDDVIVGDWVIPGEPVEVTDFNPNQDAIVYNFVGATPPTVFFGEADDGTATLEIAVSNTENQVIAELANVDFLDLSAANNLVIVQATPLA